jgi:HlyD family secretion protein
VDLGAFEVELGLPESYGDDVGLGMDVEVSYGGNTYAGFIAAVSPEVKNNEVAARVRFADAAPAGLRQNQRVSARVLFESKSDVLTLKRGPFLDSGGGRIVYVVEDGIATRRPVLTGSISIGAVEIVEGLDAGEVVIISSTELFEGADTVRLTD